VKTMDWNHIVGTDSLVLSSERRAFAAYKSDQAG